MSLFDSVLSGKIKIDNEEYLTESTELPEESEELITEAVYPESLKYLFVVQKNISLPKGEPAGRGWMCFLYSPSFEESMKMMNSTINGKSENKYYFYFYMMMYKGMIYNQRYRYRNFVLRKDLYAKIGKKTKAHPYVRQAIDPNERRNMYFELATYVSIYNKYSYKIPIPKRVQGYWTYLKPILNANPQYKKIVLVNIDNYPLKEKLRDNLVNPLYMIYYSLYRYPETLKDINVDFLFYTGKKILKINPSLLTQEDYMKVKTQMSRLMNAIPESALDEAKLHEEDLTSVITDETGKKLGLGRTVQDISGEDVETVYMQPTPLEKSSDIKEDAILKSIEVTANDSAKRILKDTKMTGEDFIQNESKVKAVVQLQVESDIEKDRKILEDAYNKLKHEKIPTSPRSSARDAQLMKEQKDLKVGNMTVRDLDKMKTKTMVIKERDVSKAVETPNEAMTKMRYFERNKMYIEKVMPTDIMNSFLALNNKSIPMFIRDYTIEESSDELNYKETYTVHLEDANRQRHTIKVDIPKIYEDRFLYLGGGYKNIKNQNYFFPVVKTKSNEVQMVSNYNKMYITRHDTKSISGVERLKRMLRQDTSVQKFIRFGNANSINKTGDFITTVEYDELAKFLKRFKSGTTEILFNQMEVGRALEKTKTTIPKGYFCVGFQGNDPIFVKYAEDQRTKDGKSICDLIVESLPEEMQTKFFKVRSPKRLMVAEVRVMKQTVTVAMLIGFWEGLETVLRKCNAKYRLEDRMPKNLLPSENFIRFKDTFLVYEDTMEVGLLLNGIRIVNTEEWALTDFNTKEPYMAYFTKVYGKASIANALLNFYEWFIDPVTKEILEDINMTTDMVGLVVYAVSLLADSQHTTIHNQRINRVRSFEIIPMVLYGQLAKQYVGYRNSNGRKKYTIPRDAVIKDLLSVVTVEDTSTLNPTLEMETTHGISFKGFHGNNLDDMYTISTRSYDKSMTGIIAPSSPPDAGCGLNKMLSLEPNITSIRGYANVTETDKDLEKLKDTNLFSAGELSMPGAAMIDDPTRLGHAIKQSRHVIPVADSDPVLVTNGFDEIERFELSSAFVVNAEEAGEVVERNEDLKLLVVKYKSGKTRAVNLGTNIVKNGGGGFYMNNQLITNLQVGDKFKKDDPLAWHEHFFTNTKYNNCRANIGTLCRVAIMSGYNTYEDATFITESMSNRCATKLTECKRAVIGKNANILSMAKEGDEINVGDVLIAFDTSYDDSDLNTLLASLGNDDDLKSIATAGSRNNIKSKYGGKLISIKMYSTVDMEELSPSLQKIFKEYYGKIRKRTKLLESYDEEGKKSIMKCGILCTDTTGKIEPNKYGTIRGENVEDSVLIEFYIEEVEPLEVASKIANFSGLKNTIGEIIPKGYEPFTEDYLPERKFDSIIAENSILKRMTPSIFKIGFANKLIVGFKEYLREIYEK